MHVLQNAQEGKTKAMRHWKFNQASDVNLGHVLAYMNEAIYNQKKGLEIKHEKKSNDAVVPQMLQDYLDSKEALKRAFHGLSKYKQKEFCEYIDSAKQQATKRKDWKKSFL